MKKKKERVVLGVGYPWFLRRSKSVGLLDKPIGSGEELEIEFSFRRVDERKKWKLVLEEP